MVLLGAGSMLAPAAMAATWTASCGAPESVDFNLAPGETFTLTVAGACDWLAPGDGDAGSTTYGPTTGTENVLTPDSWTEVSPTVTAIYTQPACGTPQLTVDALYTSSDAYTSPAANLGTYSLNFTPTECTTAPDVLQQVPLDANGSCAAVDAARHNIGGAGAGGWGTSWAQWVNDGRGGAVCTRTLTYSTSAGHYVVAS